ncbi:MAG TPA: HAMP domain-containing sensor histidine kinase [Candidatus Limnocylindrales bacterium]|jgi:signal transduction histidine kinase|nr:HAMP domain-containing sensor histidine kinase [Candidatus Limnocylindrales bacterium]
MTGIPHTAEGTADGALVRRTRWRLLAWSGGSTLLVLVALGSLLYAAVAGSLAAAGRQQLVDRADSLIYGVRASTEIVSPGPIGITNSPAEPGFQIGGATSGTVGYIALPNGVIVGADTPSNVLVENSAIVDAKQSGQAEMTETTIKGIPARILTVPVATPFGTVIVQVVGDRTDEQRTLSVLLVVLIGGGLVAVVIALILGWLYADRALVPIRDAMRRQREFAADASHELRTPLAIVNGSIEHLRRHRDRPVAEVGTALDDLEAGSDRLTALVEDLLVLARTDSGAVELTIAPIDLGEVALDAVGELASVAAKAAVEIRIDAEPLPLNGDATRLHQLVVVLVDNAIRHAAAGGGRRVDVSVRGFDGRAVLAVDDDGAGIRPEDLPRVFDRFWRAADAPAGGTGLGLAIASWIVERHGGTITATNRPDAHGARFEVRLPR